MALTLSVLPYKLAVCKLDPLESIPDWLSTQHAFFSITRTSEELSIVCDEASVPATVEAVRDWRALKVEGPLDFSLTGILYSLAKILAEAKISIFAVSTYDTDYILVQENKLAATIAALSVEHQIN